MEKFILLIGLLLPAAAFSQSPMRCLSAASTAGQYTVDIVHVNVPYLSKTGVRVIHSQKWQPPRTANLQLLHVASKTSPWIFHHENLEIVVDHRNPSQGLHQGELTLKGRAPVKLACKLLGATNGNQ